MLAIFQKTLNRVQRQCFLKLDSNPGKFFIKKLPQVHRQIVLQKPLNPDTATNSQRKLVTMVQRQILRKNHDNRVQRQFFGKDHDPRLSDNLKKIINALGSTTSFQKTQDLRFSNNFSEKALTMGSSRIFQKNYVLGFTDNFSEKNLELGFSDNFSEKP